MLRDLRFSCYAGISLRDKNNLSRTVKLIGCSLVSLPNIYEKQVIQKAMSILDCKNHPLYWLFEALPSGRRLRVPFYKSNSTKNSYIHSTIHVLNLHNSLHIPVNVFESDD